jgi:prepilin-type processing-associated H-X9-DG protein
VKVSKINAAGTVMAMDCMGTAAGKPRDQRTGHYNDGTKDSSAYGNKAVFVDPPRLEANSDYADAEKRTPEHRSGPDPRHGKDRSVGKLNVAYCDGHVDLVRPEDLGYVVNADESIAANGPGTHNQFFSGTGRDDDPPPVQ